MNVALKSLLVFFICLVMAAPAEASIRVQPLLITETLQARDAVTQNITLTNTTGTKRIVYATVNEITLGESGDIKEFISPAMSDRTDTVTSWIEIRRGRIEVDPFAEVQVPLTFRVNPQAKPGEYHAFIGFVATSKRPDAEAIALAGEANGVAVNIEIASEDTESFTVSRVESKRILINTTDKTVDVVVNNDGDIPIAPEGEVIFYSARGIEVGAEPLNPSTEVVESGETAVFSVPVSIPEKLGRYKATVNVVNSNVSILDTTEFFFVPLPILISILILLGLLSGFLTFLIKRSLDQPEVGDDGHEIPLYDNTGVQTAKDTDHDITLST